MCFVTTIFGMNPTKIMTKTAIIPSTIIPNVGVAPIFSFLNPLIGTGIQPIDCVLNRIIARNEKFNPFDD